MSVSKTLGGTGLGLAIDSNRQLESELVYGRRSLLSVAAISRLEEQTCLSCRLSFVTVTVTEE